MTGFHMTSKEGRNYWEDTCGEMERNSNTTDWGWGEVDGSSREIQGRGGGHSPATVGPFLSGGGERGREAPVGGLGLETGALEGWSWPDWAVPWGGGSFARLTF